MTSKEIQAEINKVSAMMEKYGFLAYWSIYPCPKWDEKSDIKYIRYSDHWGPMGEVVIPVSSPSTWLDVYFACDAAIRYSGDHHHVFVESLIPTRTAGHYTLHTGS